MATWQKIKALAHKLGESPCHMSLIAQTPPKEVTHRQDT
ncbi:uncharacterized protein G2W53_041220 [Senna tora]|uniref:Uncharacterized protein n=1 Tax=Senna tora TaxID=362788 RepID=A0A834SRL9_9FABA|nr:uncharacterized protein G2W53_041220 [Senna tora]